jgi:hypothetical protein
MTPEVEDCHRGRHRRGLTPVSRYFCCRDCDALSFSGVGPTVSNANLLVLMAIPKVELGLILAILTVACCIPHSGHRL